MNPLDYASREASKRLVDEGILNRPLEIGDRVSGLLVMKAIEWRRRNERC